MLQGLTDGSAAAKVSATVASVAANSFSAGLPTTSRSAATGAAAVLGMLRVAACEAPQLKWSTGCEDPQEPVSGVCKPLQRMQHFHSVAPCLDGSLGWGSSTTVE